LFMLTAAFEPFNNEQNFAIEDPAKVVPGHLNLGQRLGYAILVGGGIATINGPDSPGAAAKMQPVRDWTSGSNLTLSQLFKSCVANGATESGDQAVDIWALTASIIAAEAFNRGEFDRRLEFLFGRAAAFLTGAAPDLSYGLPQIRLSRVRDLLHQEGLPDRLSGDDLLAILENNCTAMSLAARLVKNLLDDVRKTDPGLSIDQVIVKTALTYNGAESITSSSFLYSEAVKGAYHLLTDNVSADLAADEMVPDSGTTRFCIYFGRAIWVGAPDVMSGWRNAVAQSAPDLPPAADAPSPQSTAPLVPAPAAPNKSAKALLPPASPPAKALPPPLPPSKSFIPSAPPPVGIPPTTPTPDAIPENARVTVSLWTEERSPKAFTDELNRARAGWIVDQFTQNAKLPRDQVTVRYLSARTGTALSCGEEMSATDSVAYIQISIGH
jgi:hypothetical protein